MRKFWHRYVSLFLSVIMLGGVFGVSFCIHSYDEWHVVSAKIHALDAHVHADVLHDAEQECCWDIGFGSLFDLPMAYSINFVKTMVSTSAFIYVSDGVISKPEFSISSFKTAPPEISFEGVKQNIVSRLLI